MQRETSQLAKEKAVQLHEAKPNEKTKKESDKKDDDKKGKNKADGSTSEMNAAGYDTVLSLEDKKELSTYVHRVIDAMGLKVEEDGKLKKMIDKKPENFQKLVKAVLKAKEDKILKSNVDKPKSHSDAKLDEDGYKYLLQEHDDKKMQKFIQRIVEKKGWKVKDKGALAGMAPFYSGTKDIQCYKALEKELDRVAKLPDGWVQTSSKKASTEKESGKEGKKDTGKGSKKKEKKAADKEDDKADSKKEKKKKEKKEEKKEEDEEEEEDEGEDEESSEEVEDVPIEEDTSTDTAGLGGGDLGSTEDSGGGMFGFSSRLGSAQEDSGSTFS